MTILKKHKKLNPGAEGSGALVVTAIHYEGPVGKPYGHKNGEVTKSKNHRSKKAVGETLSFASFEEFVEWREPLSTEYMLTSGTFEAIGEVPVVYKDMERDGAVSASKMYLAHREQPGILIGDIDFKDPDEVAGLYLGGAQPYKTKEAALEALDKVCPEAISSAALIGWSTSSNLFKGKNQVKGTGGIRVYLPISNASKIPDLLDIMHKRSWINGEGWAFVDKAGQFQKRSLFDMALKSVTQPDYAAPDLQNGLTQDREWEVFTGDYLDPASVAPLTPEEEEMYLTAVAAAKAALAPEMEAQRKIWLAKNAKTHEQKGLDPKRAMSAAVQLLDNAVLFPTGSVNFDDGSVVSVLDLLTDGSTHDGKTCKDPVEPDYNDGASVGIFFWNDGGFPIISSFAHGQKTYRLQHDENSIRAVIDSKDRDNIYRALALSGTDDVTYTMLISETAKALGIGTRTKVIVEAVAKLKGEMRRNYQDMAVNFGADIDGGFQHGQWPMDRSLPPEKFPFNNDGTLLCHEANYEFMLNGYGIEFAYDMVSKKLLWTSHGLDTETDNAELALFSRIKSLAALNGLPSGNDALHTFLPAIAETKQVNRVRDYLEALEWDGNDRFKKLSVSIGAHDENVALISIQRWFIQACAAADGGTSAIKNDPSKKAVYEYVLVMRSDQGDGKTKGLVDITPEALRPYLKESVVLNTNNKDIVKQAISCWIAELGELDATFKAADHVAFKAFMSREFDELRMPFAPKSSRFRRRTVFFGSVNDPAFLKDKTGGRRFYPLSVDRGFPAWPDAELDQLWAQAWSLYIGGEQWWPTTDEAELLGVNAELFREKSWVEEELETEYAWGEPPSAKPRRKASALLRDLKRQSGSNMDRRELSDVGHALRRLWSENGAYKYKGELLIDTPRGPIRVHADGGKCPGWLLPPTKVAAALEKDDE